MSNANRAAVRFTPKTITLSMKCAELLNYDYIEILFNPREKLIAIRPSSEDRPGALKWRKEVDGKYATTSIGCAAFTSLVYELMQWPTLWNTSVLAQIYSKEDQTVFVFDLTQYEINALEYAKPKKAKNRRENDVFYDIELMIAQQIELLHQKQTKDMVLEEKESEEELPPPKRHRFHPGKWFATFGEKIPVTEIIYVDGMES